MGLGEITKQANKRVGIKEGNNEGIIGMTDTVG